MKLYKLRRGDVIEIDGIKAVFFKCDGAYAQLFEYGKEMKSETLFLVSCGFDRFIMNQEAPGFIRGVAH